MAITPVGFTGTVTEASFSRMMSAVGGYGILGTVGGTNFAAARVAGSRTVTVQPGEIWAPGIHVTMDAVTTPTAVAANVSGSNRIDLLVMRVNWSTDTCALMILPGGTSPPSYNINPGILYDIPLYQLVLAPSAADYTTVNIAAGDIRTYMVDGITAISANALPDTFPGRLWTRPFDGKIILGGSGSETSTFRAQKDSGWFTVMGAPAGFSGSLKARSTNGIVKLAFNWTKEGGGTGTGVDFSVTLPGDLWPGGGVDITETIWAGSNPCRLYVSAGTGSMGFNNVTMAAGQIITGSPVWHDRYYYSS